MRILFISFLQPRKKSGEFVVMHSPTGKEIKSYVHFTALRRHCWLSQPIKVKAEIWMKKAQFDQGADTMVSRLAKLNAAASMQRLS
jgi:hypothetical protein